MSILEVVIIVSYLLVTGYLGFLGYRRTRTSADYLLAGREMHPVVMALSYGATFVSTSAIIGFGGIAAGVGLSLLWLLVLNITVGVFIAFICVGEPTRRIGHRLGAHTFPEFLGKRYQSRFVQIFAGLVILLFMPLYTTAVLLGGAEFVQTAFHLPDFNTALLILALLIGAYVLAGGLKGVMYTDAFQGMVMILDMGLLLVLCYTQLGGISAAHRALAAMADQVPADLRAQGHQGWTVFPAFGWGNKQYNLGWFLISTLVLGVGIGVLAQPQLAVRFMTVRSRRELNRAVVFGAIFMLFAPGAAFVTGALSNVYFRNVEMIEGRIVNENREAETLTILPSNSIDQSRAITVPITPDSEILRSVDGAPDRVRPRLNAAMRTENNLDRVMPLYIERAFPPWFGVLFLVTLLAAAMSTLSSQLHTMGTAIGRDLLEQFFPNRKSSSDATVIITRIGIIAGLLVSVLLASKPLRGYIAESTALFFGLCAASFLPAFLGGLYWKRMTRAGAIASMTGGFAVSLVWMLFFFQQTARPIGLCAALTGKTVLLTNPNWPVVDPLLIGLPVAVVLAIAVSLVTAPPSKEHIDLCFRK